MPPQIAPQAAPTAQPSLMAPTQAQAQPAPAPQKAEAKPDAGFNQAMAPVAQRIEQHLNSLPPEQQQFVAKFMTPELALVLGILLGDEAFQYFKQFADPNKQLTVTAKQNAAPQPAAQGGQQPTQPQPQPQSQASPPGRTIMGR